jgi:hypothetical protein
MSLGTALTLLASSVLVIRNRMRLKEAPAVSSVVDSSKES